MALNKKAFALSSGIVSGAAFLVITLIFIIFGHEGNQLNKLHSLFIGYRVSWPGALLGLVWGFVYGVIGGWIFAWLYNRLEQ